jgi:NAD(P)H-dependent FMN reductase
VTSILMISGSVRLGSVNAAVIATAAASTPEGVSAVTYDGIGDLPHFNPDLDHDPLPQRVIELRRAIDQASALLISTPEYAGAMPGALKNLLEWTVGGVETTQKPTGWINPSAILNRSAGTYASLRTVLEYTGCRIVDEACVDVPVPRALLGQDGLVPPGPELDAIRAGVAALAAAA